MAWERLRIFPEDLKEVCTLSIGQGGLGASDQNAASMTRPRLKQKMDGRKNIDNNLIESLNSQTKTTKAQKER